MAVNRKICSRCRKDLEQFIIENKLADDPLSIDAFFRQQGYSQDDKIRCWKFYNEKVWLHEHDDPPENCTYILEQTITDV